jgi:hypothetical protein
MARIVPRASANVVITGRSGWTGRRHAASAMRLNTPRRLTPSLTSPARWSMTAISGRSAQQIHSLMTLLTWRPSPSGKRKTACCGIPTRRTTTRNPLQPPRSSYAALTIHGASSLSAMPQGAPPLCRERGWTAPSLPGLRRWAAARTAHWSGRRSRVDRAAPPSPPTRLRPATTGALPGTAMGQWHRSGGAAAT